MTHIKQSRPLHQQSVITLRGVGDQLAAKLTRLNLFTLQDILFHLPCRYEDRTRIVPVGSLLPFTTAVIEGEIRQSNIVIGRRRSLVCQIGDGSGSIILRFYHFSNSQQSVLAPGKRLRCFGEVRPGASGLEIYHPEYQVVDDNSSSTLEKNLTPVYHATDGVTQSRLRALVRQTFALLQGCEHRLVHLLPQKQNTPLLDRLHYLHFPPQDANLRQLSEGQHPWQQQLIREELTAYQLGLLRLRQRRRQQLASALPPAPQLTATFTDNLSFQLTAAQRRVCAEVGADISRPVPMMRLLQGDVGSGKTVVAAISTLQAVADNRQVALMAPTDILAEQHRLSFEEWLRPLGITMGWLSGKQKAGERRQQLEDIKKGGIQVVIGTHALFQDEVIFHDLVLVIIDEQHRFGVHQRLRLRNKGREQQTIPHQLIMTATPIPRTLAMSAWADLDYSVIDELPAGRIPVETVLVNQNRRPEVVERIRHACLAGRQAYWVCTLIEQSEALSAEAAEDTAANLQKQLPELQIALVHGRLKPKEKNRIMTRFKGGEIHLLVATTVIEVGVDVPNASLMIIENSERLGLAQLHQLRGRIGRGAQASHCVLLYDEALSNNGRTRLQAMRDTSDGFTIAEIDLQVRGPGEVLGTRQTGDINFRLADLQRDMELLPRAKAQAVELLARDQAISSQLIDRWMGNSEQFARV